MLLIILCVLLLVLGITLLHLQSSCNYNSIWNHDGWMVFGMFLAALGIVGTLLSGSFAITRQVTKETEYQKSLYEREVLEYRLEHHDENIVGNEMLYTEIVEFNNDLRVAKKWAGNPWVGCFNNDLLADIDYIEYEREG